VVSRIISTCILHSFKAHQHYRSPHVDPGKLVSTSRDRFLRMFNTYRAQETSSQSSSRGIVDMTAKIESELQSVMQKTDNIALVAFQAFLGMTVYWNAARMLARSREVPADWIRFVAAEDDYIYFG
jgi:hypothetical protein